MLNLIQYLLPTALMLRNFEEGEKAAALLGCGQTNVARVYFTTTINLICRQFSCIKHR